MAAVRVRPTTPTEADRLALAGLRRSWTEEDAGAPIDDPAFDARAVTWIAANEPHRPAWLAEVEAEPAGFVTAVVLERMPRPGQSDTRWGYVHHLFVAPAHRSRGVGRQLLDAVVAHGERSGWELLLLHPRERSWPFYERAGFVVAEEWAVRRLG